MAGRNLTDDSRIDLTWDAGCGSGIVAYAVYAGLVGEFTSHDPHDCAVAALGHTLLPSPGDRYYLVVPVSANAEGDYGTRFDGPRPPSTSACEPQLLDACP